MAERASRTAVCHRPGAIRTTEELGWILVLDPADDLAWTPKDQRGWWSGIAFAEYASSHHSKLFTLLDLRVSSLSRGHANLLYIVPMLTDDPRRESLTHLRITIQPQRECPASPGGESRPWKTQRSGVEAARNEHCSGVSLPWLRRWRNSR